MQIHAISSAVYRFAVTRGQGANFVCMLLTARSVHVNGAREAGLFYSKCCLVQRLADSMVHIGQEPSNLLCSTLRRRNGIPVLALPPRPTGNLHPQDSPCWRAPARRQISGPNARSDLSHKACQGTQEPEEPGNRPPTQMTLFSRTRRQSAGGCPAKDCIPSPKALASYTVRHLLSRAERSRQTYISAL